ncbi:DUF350 domain-containing protein [Roseivirga sp. BDSF3-8]|uniref:DUF350 domain-containing protein n=1 Tax=Roseivirga sp. BDSF3-8 TaxID=3241598 RepID=UPI0035318C9C
MTIDTILTSLVYLAAAFLLFFIGKVVFQLFHPKINMKHELVEADNAAFALALTGYYTGLLLAIGSAIVGPSQGLVTDLINIGLYGLLAILLLNLAAIFNDKVLLRHFEINKELIKDRNAGTGAVEAANYIATGLIVYGAVVGEGGSWLTAIIIWVAGQLILLLTSLVYNLIVPYSIHKQIEKDNVAVGIGYAGAIISIGNLVRHGAQYDFTGWEDMAYNIGIETGIGLVFLPIVRFATDRILLPGRSMTDELVNQDKPNLGVGLLEGFAYVGGSVLITYCL